LIAVAPLIDSDGVDPAASTADGRRNDGRLDRATNPDAPLTIADRQSISNPGCLIAANLGWTLL
jgi:hypothetical protein